jgi:hypothetical protein
LEGHSLDLRRFLPSDTKKMDEDSESLVEGVTVKKFEYKGFEFNFPGILRKLKRNFDRTG